MTVARLRPLAREAGFAALILVLCTAAALLLVRPPSPLAAAERLFQAATFRLLAPVEPQSERVVVIGITEETLAPFPYRSPIDRAFLAGLIDRLAEAGVAAVGLDVLLDRPTESGKDAALRRALARADVPVVAISVSPDTPMPPERREVLASFLDGVRSGDANLARDRFDGMVREHVPAHPVTGAPSFPASLARALGVAVPDAPFTIAWRRTAQGPGAPVYPAEAVPMLPAEWLRGRVALIGSMIPGTDEHRTPASAFGRPSFGVEIHAQVLAQLLEGRAVPGGPGLPPAEMAATAGMAVAGLAVAAGVGGAAAVAALGALALGFVAATAIAADGGATPFPYVGPVLACLLAGGSMRAWRGRGERRDRQLLRMLFARYVSEPVVQEILRERDLFLAGGRPRPQELTATVLFSDVAGFTSICERLPPEPLIAWLDRYIDTMVGVMVQHRGVVLRFVGDGLLGVFGAPVPRRDEAAVAADAQDAARCALAMEAAMRRLNEEWRAAGLPEAGLRIGIHTGPLVAGSLGRGSRMEFCLLGDTANTGARLEQLGKEYSGSDPRYCTILVGEPTWRLLGGAFPGRHVGQAALRGRSARLAVYRIDSAALAPEPAAAASAAAGGGAS